MPNSNEFLSWATAAGALVHTAAEYAALVSRQQGAQVGELDPEDYNTPLRQATSMSAMLGQFMADRGPSNVLDNGNIAGLEGQFIAALTQLIGAILGPNNLFVGTDTGVADALQVDATSPVLSAYANNQVFMIEIGANNVTTTPHMQVGSLGALPMFLEDHTQIPVGFLQEGTKKLIACSGSALYILGTSRQSFPPINGVVVRSTTNYVVPDNVFGLRDVRVWGGGGGGGGVSGTNGSAAGGGGGGFAYKAWVPVTPGQILLMEIGGGGLGGIGASNGQAGGTTILHSTTPVQATGGNGGSGQPVDDAGLGGVGSGGDMNLIGHPGGGTFAVGGNTSGLQPGSGAGGASPFGGPNTQLALSGDTGGNGPKGGFPGGGAGGAFCATGTYDGGQGAAGMISFNV